MVGVLERRADAIESRNPFGGETVSEHRAAVRRLDEDRIARSDVGRGDDQGVGDVGPRRERQKEMEKAGPEASQVVEEPDDVDEINVAVAVVTLVSGARWPGRL